MVIFCVHIWSSVYLCVLIPSTYKDTSHIAIGPSIMTLFFPVSFSVMFDSFWPHGLKPQRLLSPWDSPGKNTGVGCHFFPQGIFLTQGSNQVSCIAGRFFTIEPPGKPPFFLNYPFGGPVSKYSHILKYWGLGLQNVNLIEQKHNSALNTSKRPWQASWAKFPLQIFLTDSFHLRIKMQSLLALSLGSQ